MWKGRLSEAACERADDHGWCSEFDDFMAQWGMEGRVRVYDVAVEVTARVRSEPGASAPAQRGAQRASDSSSSRRPSPVASSGKNTSDAPPSRT